MDIGLPKIGFKGNESKKGSIFDVNQTILWEPNQLKAKNKEELINAGLYT